MPDTTARKPLSQNPQVANTVIIAGAQKAGTTSLYALLDSHPKIAMSVVKEPNRYCIDLWPFFAAHIKPHTSRDIEELIAHGKTRHIGLIQSEETYELLFKRPLANVQYVGEASASYLCSLDAAREIARHRPAAKIIVILRDPVKRLLSQRTMGERDAKSSISLETALRRERLERENGKHPYPSLLGSSLYGAALQRFYAQFPDEQILLVDFSELSEPERLILKIAAFLDIDPQGFTPSMPHRNKSVSARHVGLNQLLVKSGLKNVIRSLIPQILIDRLKPFYYQEKSNGQQLEEAIRQELMDVFRSDLTLLNALVGHKPWPWIETYLGDSHRSTGRS